MTLTGNSLAAPTTLVGGLFNSGSLTVTSTTTGKSVVGSTVTAMSIGSYVDLGSFSPGFTKNPASGLNPGDQAALVNSGGTISAYTSGTRGGTATAISIAAGASVPSLINTGTISASVSVTDTTSTGEIATGSNPVVAEAIVDQSGTLDSIINAGTISASVTTLDNDTQRAIAIDLSAGSATSTTSAVSILDQSGGSTPARIIGDIAFGTGNNQSLTIIGNGPNAVGQRDRQCHVWLCRSRVRFHGVRRLPHHRFVWRDDRRRHRAQLCER